MKIGILDSINRIGVSFARNESEGNDIILSNQISLLLSFLPLVYIATNVYNLGWSRITLPIKAQPAFFLIPILLNYLGAITLSRIFLSWSMAIAAIYFSVYNKSHGIDFETSHYVGIRFSILASAVIPFLVFRLKNVFLILLSLSASFLSLILFDFIHSSFGVGYQQVGLKEIGYSLTTMRTLVGFIMITGSSLFLKRMVEKKEKSNNELIFQLEEKNNEILGQLEEISSQNEYISLQKDQLESQKQLIELQNSRLHRTNDELELRVEEKTRDILAANVELERQNVQLEQFAFMAAHNLRSPVARIQGLTDVLNHAKTEPIEKDKILHLIKKSSADLDEVIHDLISVVQVRSQGESSKSKINVVALLKRVLEHISHDIESNKIEIVNSVDPDLELEVNEALAYSVLLNVISNSIKYKNNNQPHVVIKGERGDSQIVLDISDNGIGFNSDLHKDKLFRPFSRLNTILPGKGLGLYLVKIHMESMGGQVMVNSKMENGTTVTLLFKSPGT